MGTGNTKGSRSLGSDGWVWLLAVDGSWRRRTGMPRPGGGGRGCLVLVAADDGDASSWRRWMRMPPPGGGGWGWFLAAADGAPPPGGGGWASGARRGKGLQWRPMEK
nr:unnamed protein product [Digitaria exilis]